jgi:hypothetical protein
MNLEASLYLNKYLTRLVSIYKTEISFQKMTKSGSKWERKLLTGMTNATQEAFNKDLTKLSPEKVFLMKGLLH